ncbi:MAG: pilus assembly protein PilM, partial [Candidatus Parcubacteria bacterium]|nr:pilus assembly protein PilM [Candidatus Parcubacteria bacterium]
MAFNWLKIKKVLIPQMEVVGLSISEDGIRLVSFKPNSYIIKSFQGVSFVPGVIEKGILKKPEVLQAAIASIKNKVWKKKEERFVVLSLPSQNFYTNIVSMPDLPASEFENSIKLNTQMNSPLPIEQSYFDWQIINTNLGNNPDPNLKQVFVALSDKSCIDPYLAAIENEGIKTMATELEPFSTARLMSGLGCRGPYLYINLKRDGLYLYIFNNDIPVFSDYDSWAEVSGSNDG